jgi:hypothetical protein
MHRAGSEKPDVFIKGEHCRAFTARHGLLDELQRQERLAYAGWSENQGRRASLQATAEQGVEFVYARLKPLAPKVPMVFGGHQTREYFQSAAREYNVVKPASIRLASALDDAQTAALGAVFRCDFLKMDNPMRYAVSRPLRGLGG